MKSLKLTDSLYWVGVQDPELRVFDIIMMTEFGTTYNSYALIGSEKTAIFETSKLKFWDEYRERLEDIVKIEDIDYIIMDHTEPDHAGTIARLLEINPQIVVVGTSTAISFLKEIINFDFFSMAVSTGDSISLGDKTLEFTQFPNLHWPDTMYTYCPEEKALFTCDSFGAHYSHDGVLRSVVEDEEGYKRAAKYYFDNIIGPFKQPFMYTALQFAKGLDLNFICTGHGPVHDAKIDTIFEWYDEWVGEPAEKTDKKLVVIPYVSAYGYTEELAEKIADGIKESSPKISVELYDLVTADAGIVADRITAADGLLFGTPTILADALAPIWDLLTGMYPPVHGGKVASAFGSYGWSGEGVPNIIERLKQLKLNVVEGFTVRFKPSETQLMDAFDYGYRFGLGVVEGIMPEKKEERYIPGGKVKCLVCGEVFDAGTEVCPVCGVGPENFVPVEEKVVTYSNDTNERFIIIGGGPGAHYAAEAIRDRNKTASIYMITQEKELPYNRPMLTKALLDDVSDDKLAIEGADWYKKRNIIVIRGLKVESIDIENKKVMCGEAYFNYDKLIYALGAYCAVPKTKGVELDHVVTVRNVSDCEKIQAMRPNIKNAIVIGGGVMGIESAWELKKAGYDVTIMQRSTGLLNKQLDPRGSEILGKIAEKAGIKVVFKANTQEITKDAVILEDGSSYPADLVIISTGMRPYTKVAQDSGIEVDKYVLTNRSMETSAPDVYACGDCCSVDGKAQSFWAQAVETGRVAGANAAGDSLTYRMIGSSLSMNAMNASVFALGTNGTDGREYRTVCMEDTQRLTYEKLFFYHNILEGVILIGDTSKLVEYTDAIENRATYEQVMK